MLTWLNEENSKVRDKSITALRKLALFGYELRRPHADYLRDGIHELRLKDGRRNIRILYFYHGSNLVVVSHGLAKEDVVPPREIDLALARKATFTKAPSLHTLTLDQTATTQEEEENEKEQNHENE
jgi:phage-related protein